MKSIQVVIRVASSIVIKGIMLIINEAKRYQVFNLGNDKEIEILRLAKKIKKITSSRSEIVFKPLPEDDPEKRKPDLTKITTKLGWQPKTKLESGLLKTISYFKKEYQS